MLAEQLIHSGADAKRVSRFLGWQEFEDFAEHILSENGFSTCKHLVFKSSLGRREIDIFAWNDTLILAVDCKHWIRGLSTGRMKKAAQAQIERTIAVARRPELLHRLKVPIPDVRSVIPVILTLGEVRDRLIHGVPIVPVSKLSSFIYEVSPIDKSIKRIRVDSSSQSRLAQDSWSNT
jgi:Holliday junction resolvase-like predicted endonuclease